MNRSFSFVYTSSWKETKKLSHRTASQFEVAKIIDAWASSVRDVDLDGILRDHDEDIVMFDVPMPLQLRGLDSYRRAWDLFFSYQPDGNGFDLEDIQIHAGDEVAFAHALVRVNQEPTPSVRLTVGLRLVAGRWTVVHEHHSAPYVSERVSIKESI